MPRRYAADDLSAGETQARHRPGALTPFTVPSPTAKDSAILPPDHPFITRYSPGQRALLACAIQLPATAPGRMTRRVAVPGGGLALDIEFADLFAIR
jgi:hypothetical protein